MEIKFAILYHPTVVREDIPSLTKKWRERVRTSIEEKLAYMPERYGKPLRSSLRGYRKLRVGDHRIVYRIEKRNVYVLAILHRSIVYKRSPTRIGRPRYIDQEV